VSSIEPVRATASVVAPSGSRPTGTLSLKASSPGEPVGDVTGSGNLRSAFFVDGFNLYHAIDELKKPHLKWFDLRKACEHLIDKSHEKIIRIVWCSAEPKDSGKRARHRAFQKALEVCNVEIKLGHFIETDEECRSCKAVYKKPNEKEGDVNLAIHAAVGAAMNEFDVGYLLTADSDQVATLKLIKQLSPNIRMHIVSPPGREHSYHLLQCVEPRMGRAMTERHIEASVLPKEVLKNGKLHVSRPDSYAKPLTSLSGNKGKFERRKK
jgi:hypothetical protein